ncbi:hypothetical protein Sked_28140 [Sanguibacter keddieii DSM 10542]|uniref:Uncharacterized protein n=1 Tax=Sanguibacter keddieii (strain ATCC 51767 / DSM 10542 / NCFB 3025 / ST-74) TaxID=446469 RepID=D1BB15_SANKS|nr:hypothetical protein Sked_28140 [Sanguibacter keddieii DSM 10542]
MVGVNRGPRSDDPTSGRPVGVRRTLEQDTTTRSDGPSSLGGPWVSGVLGAIQAVVFSLAVVVVPAIAMAVAANAQLSASTSGWTAAVPVASRLWLLGHGVPLVTGIATVTIVPLGITAAAVFAVFVSARRTIVPTRSAFWSAAATYTVGTLLVAVSTGSTSGLQLTSAALGGLAVALVGLCWGLLTGPEPGPLADRAAVLAARLPQVVRDGARGAATAAAVVALLSGLLTLLWVMIGWSTVGDVLSDLRLDAASSISLGIAQLALLPNLAVFAGTWIAGPGFAVGSGTHFGPDLVTSAPLPAIPLLGALPAPSAGGGVGVWAPVLVGVAGVVGGWVASRRTEHMLWWHTVVVAGLVGTGAGVAAGTMVALASGVAGPGRLADVGASPVYLGACVAAQVGAGALLVLLVTRAEVHAALASAWRSMRSRRREGAGGERAAAGDGSPDKAGADKAGADKAGADKAGADKAGACTAPADSSAAAETAGGTPAPSRAGAPSTSGTVSEPGSASKTTATSSVPKASGASTTATPSDDAQRASDDV